MNKLRVFVADDHAIVREGLRAVIGAQPDMEVVGEASDGTSIVEKVAASGAEIVVMDISMPRMSGYRATEELRRSLGKVPIVALSAHEEADFVRRMLAAGAAGYIVKRSVGDELIRAIRAVARGQTYVDPSIGGGLFDAVTAGGQGQDATSAKLSDREAEVLRLIARGYALKEISAALDISVRTIETYHARAMLKLGLRSRADVVRFAAEQGWLIGA